MSFDTTFKTPPLTNHTAECAAMTFNMQPCNCAYDPSREGTMEAEKVQSDIHRALFYLNKRSWGAPQGEMPPQQFIDDFWFFCKENDIIVGVDFKNQLVTAPAPV